MNRTKKAHRITLPTHIIWGKEGQAIPVGRAYIAVKILPDSNLHIIDCCGHLPVECAGEFNRLVLEFLAQ